MQSILVRHTVKDFATWKTGYDAHAGARASAGLTSIGLWRNHHNPNEVVAVLRAQDMAKAQALFGSEDMRQTMVAAGVIGQPDVTILDEA